MHDSNQIKMTSGEILVLAAAMGFETVYGIEPVSVIDLKERLRSWVQTQFKSLMNKGIVEYSIEGVLYVQEVAKKSVEGICKANTVVMLDDNVVNGRAESIRELYCSEYKVTLKRASREDNYEITLFEEKDSMDIPEYLFADVRPDSDIHGRIDAKELYRIKDKIQSFLIDEASEDLRHNMTEEEAKVLEGILDNTSRYVFLKVFKRRDNLFECVHSDILSVGPNLVKLSEDDGGSIHFDTIPMDSVFRDINAVINDNGVESNG